MFDTMYRIASWETEAPKPQPTSRCAVQATAGENYQSQNP
jgi:hypothetical protein